MTSVGVEWNNPVGLREVPSDQALAETESVKSGDEIKFYPQKRSFEAEVGILPQRAAWRHGLITPQRKHSWTELEEMFIEEYKSFY